MNSHIERIKKCLQLAGNNSSQNEVESALKMAQRLALKVGVNLDEIEIDTNHKRGIEFTKGVVDQTTKNVPMWRYTLCKIIAENFRCDVVQMKSYKGSNIVIIGDVNDVEVVKDVFTYCENAYLDLSKRFINELKTERKLDRSMTIRYKNDYFRGFKDGIKQAFEDNIKEFGLIVIKPDEVIDYIRTECRQSKSAESVSAGSSEAKERGRSDGHFTGQAKRHEYIN